jgi:GDP-L-fucose synthase
MSEDDLLSGYLEPTNESYAIAKIAGIKMCQAYNRQYGTNFICAVPTNVYGPNDNFDPIDSHVIPALLRKFYDAKRRNAQEVIIWGTGNPTREFIYSDDLADACVFLMAYYDDSGMINIGSGEEITIKDLSYLISDIVGYDGYIIFDSSKPDGMPRKVLNSSKLKRLGWAPRVSLREGLQETNNWYLKNEGKLLKTWTEKTPRY